MGKRGPKSKYNEETHRRLVEAIRLGATYALAAAYAGIGYRTLLEWRKIHPQLEHDIRIAEGEAATRWLQRIEDAAAKEWTAAAWKLERRYPDQYGRRVEEQRVRNDDIPAIPWERIPEDMQIAFLDKKLTLHDILAYIQEQQPERGA